VIVGIASGVATGAGGVPPRMTAPSGTSGGSGSSNQAVRRNGGSGIPPNGERRYVPDEVVLELAAGISEPAAVAVARRHRLVRL